MKVLINNKIPINVVRGNDKFWMQVNDNKWERETFVFLDRFSDKRHSFLNIGAWIGALSIYSSYFNHHCYAIEPDPIAYRTLCKNISINNCSNISTYNIALHTSNKTIRLFSANKWNQAIFGDSRSNTLRQSMIKNYDHAYVPTTGMTFDNFLRNYVSHDFTDCKVIKMDIEGSEALVIPTMRQFLKTYHPTLWVSFHVSVIEKQELTKTLQILFDVGYKFIYHGSGKPFDKGKFKLIMDAYLYSKNFALVFSNCNWSHK